jgi:hypothetical protein
MRGSIKSRSPSQAGKRYRNACPEQSTKAMRSSITKALCATTAAVAMAGVPASASASVYKCVDVDGKQPIYQDSPCPAGRELRNFDTDPAEVSVIPFRAVPGTTTTQVAPKAAKAPPATKAEKKKEIAAVADIAQRRFIVPGMSEGEVVARIGSPDMSSGGKGRKTSRWSYLPAAGDPQTITTVVFDYGKVIEVERKVVK